MTFCRGNGMSSIPNDLRGLPNEERALLDKGIEALDVRQMLRPGSLIDKDRDGRPVPMVLPDRIGSFLNRGSTSRRKHATFAIDRRRTGGVAVQPDGG